eukprot:4772073-Pyramimonas_sp.AAC.1
MLAPGWLREAEGSPKTALTEKPARRAERALQAAGLEPPTGPSRAPEGGRRGSRRPKRAPAQRSSAL